VAESKVEFYKLRGEKYARMVHEKTRERATYFLDCPTCELTLMDSKELNNAIAGVINELKPEDVLFRFSEICIRIMPLLRLQLWWD